MTASDAQVLVLSRGTRKAAGKESVEYEQNEWMDEIELVDDLVWSVIAPSILGHGRLSLSAYSLPHHTHSDCRHANCDIHAKHTTTLRIETEYIHALHITL